MTAFSPPELTVIAPTFNERDNVGVLVERLRAALSGVEWRLIVVDDNSPDGTADVVKTIAAQDPRVQCLRRVGRRGLAGAVIEGVLAASTPYVAVIDADGQHDERLLPRMLDSLRANSADLLIGSRLIDPQGLEVGLSPLRRMGTRLAGALARLALKTDVTDPMSGFFMVRRPLFESAAPGMSPEGFKVLFDLIASQQTPPRILELPYAFGEREHGASKMDGRVVLDYLGLLLTKLTGGLLPQRVLLFGLAGASGLIVHLSLLRMLMLLGIQFDQAQTLAAIGAMTSNFLVNNRVTYRDRRLSGWRMLTGYLKFCAACALGLAANIAVASLVNRLTGMWWLAGVAGALFGAAWNFLSTALAVW